MTFNALIVDAECAVVAATALRDALRSDLDAELDRLRAEHEKLSAALASKTLELDEPPTPVRGGRRFGART